MKVKYLALVRVCCVYSANIFLFCKMLDGVNYSKLRGAISGTVWTSWLSLTSQWLCT